MVGSAVVKKFLNFGDSFTNGRRDFVSGTGIDADKICDNKWIPLQDFYNLLDHLNGLSSSPCFGFDVGRSRQVGEMGLVDYLMAASYSLKDAFDSRFEHLLLSGNFQTEYLTVGNGVVRYRLQFVDRRIRRHELVEYWITGFMMYTRKVLAKDWSPDVIRVKEPTLPDYVLNTYTSFLNCPVEVGAPVDEIIFRPQLLDARLKTRDPFLKELLLPYGQNELFYGPKTSAKSVFVYGLLRRELRLKHPVNVIRTAKLMGISTRCLQYTLAEESTTFYSLLDRVRKELAGELLINSALSIKEIAHHLGFSNVRSFYSAFQRWFGKTPRLFRHAPDPKQIQPE